MPCKFWRGFESSVKSYVVKTSYGILQIAPEFESSVKSYVVKTELLPIKAAAKFESSVKSYVVKTMLNYGYMG